MASSQPKTELQKILLYLKVTQWPKSKIFWLLIIFISGICALFLYYYRPYAFTHRVQKCNEVSDKLRFSCYRKVIANYYSGNLGGYIKSLDDISNGLFTNNDTSYAIFGTNCHTFYHALGDFMAAQPSGDVKLCPDTCTGGCVMGFLKRKAYGFNYDSKKTSELFDSCADSQKAICAHEIGHIFNDKFQIPVLERINDLTRASGMFVGDSDSTSYEKIGEEEKAFDGCRSVVPAEHLASCYEGVGHNIFLFMEFSLAGYDNVVKKCVNLTSSDKDVCYSLLAYRVGINEVASEFLRNKFEEGNTECSNVLDSIGEKKYLENCYQGLGRGIGLFLQSQYPGQESRTKSETLILTAKLVRYSDLCRHAKPGYDTFCYEGLVGTKFLDYYSSLNLKIDAIEATLSPRN
jgi:hypothetical protein